MLALLPLWYVAFLMSLTCHEAAHALVAKWGGDLTAAMGGQVTLNPIPHMRREMFGTVFVPLISYALGGWMIGWASAPFDPYWQRRHPHRAAWMALAGPAANLALAILAAAAMRAGVAFGVFEPAGYPAFARLVAGAAGSNADAAASLLSIIFSINILLMSFNLLPVPPLDGNTAVGLLMSKANALKFLEFSRQPGFAMLGLVLAWVLFGRIFQPIYFASLNLLYFGM